MSTDTQILMSRSKPDGQLLEDILLLISNDLLLKNQLIAKPYNDVSNYVLANNLKIIDMLVECRDIQLDSMKKLEDIGPNLGIKFPRI